MGKPNRGVKRKRVESENFAGDASRIPRRLHHGLREIRKAAKKAKVFETQKLVKKLKDARKKGAGNAEIAEHEAQLNVLKNIDHEVFANTATKTKIMKDKVLSQQKQIQESLFQELGDKVLSTSAQEGPPAKVHSRLLSSKILATEISSLCNDLRGLLGHESKKSRMQADGNDVDTPEIQKDSTRRETKPSVMSHEGPKSDVDSEDEEESGIDESGWESGTVDEEHGADGWNSGINPLGEEESDDPETDDDGGSESGRRTKPARPGASVKAPQKPSDPSGTASTFLPSLSVGFVLGSDESDWSDNEANIADVGKKKNRRGQRARRMIWEKKYGRNANHKKKELEAKGRRTLEGGDKNKRDGVYRGFQRPVKSNITTDGNKRHSEPGSSLPTGTRPRTSPKADQKPLHPSWEAKRKLKEQQGASIILSQATKIKFSD